jgi:hypothetical protein
MGDATVTALLGFENTFDDDRSLFGQRRFHGIIDDLSARSRLIAIGGTPKIAIGFMCSRSTTSA